MYDVFFHSNRMSNRPKKGHGPDQLLYLLLSCFCSPASILMFQRHSIFCLIQLVCCEFVELPGEPPFLLTPGCVD